jgi:hypothetical protein
MEPYITEQGTVVEGVLLIEVIKKIKTGVLYTDIITFIAENVTSFNGKQRFDDICEIHDFCEEYVEQEELEYIHNNILN